MKIYSLQEENEKMKARQGIHPLNNGNVFETGRRPAPAQRQNKQIPPASRKSPAPVPAPKGNPPQNRKTALAFIRILWIVFLLFFVVMGFLADK